MGLGNRRDMKDVGFSTKENLCISESAIDSWSIARDFVSEEIILESEYIHCRVRSSPSLKNIPTI